MSVKQNFQQGSILNHNEINNKTISFKNSFSSSKKYSIDDSLSNKENKISILKQKLSRKINWGQDLSTEQKDIEKENYSSEDNLPKHKILQRGKTINLEIKDKFLETDQIKFISSFDDNSNFTFLNLLSPHINKIKTENINSKLNINLSSIIKSCSNSPQKSKSFKEDFLEVKSNYKKNQNFVFDFHSLEENSVETIHNLNQQITDNININLNCNITIESDKEKIEDITTENIRCYYEYTYECMKKIKRISKEQKGEMKEIPAETLEFIEKEILVKNKKVAVFDLDETLVHWKINPDSNNKYDEILENLSIEDKILTIGINTRPYLKEALQEISKCYFLVVISGNKKAYSEVIMNYLDPEWKLFSLRLYQENCIKVKLDGDNLYIKDLRIFKTIPTSKIIIIDKSILSFAFHIENGIPILPYLDSKTDNEMKLLVSYLNHLSQLDDIMEENKRVFNLENLFSNLSISAININSSKKYNDTTEEEFFNSNRTLESGVSKPDNLKEQISKRIRRSLPKINSLQLTNYIKNNFNSNSSNESNSILSCLILLNKINIPNYDSITNNNITNTFLYSDIYSKSD